MHDRQRAPRGVGGAPRRNAAANSTDPDRLHALASPSKGVVTRKAVARNAATAPVTLAVLCRDPDPWVRFEAARRPATPVESLLALLKDPNVSTRRSLAGNLRVPVQSALALHLDPDEVVRRRLAGRADLPDDFARLFAADTSSAVRTEVARRPVLPEGLRQQFAHDDDPRVRAAAARYADDLPLDALEEVLARTPEAARRLSRRTETPMEEATLLALTRSPDKYARLNVAQRPDCPLGVLRVLALDEDVDVRAAVVQHANADDALLTSLARGQSKRVVSMIWHSDARRGWLTGHPDPLVRRNAVRAITSTWTEFESFLADPDADVRLAAVKVAGLDPRLVGLAADPDGRVRAAVAAKVSDRSALHEMSRDRLASVRKAVAANRFTAAETLAALAGDSAPGVRSVAGERFMAALARD